VEVVASLSQGRTAAAQCGLFTHKSVPVIFEPPCMFSLMSFHFPYLFTTSFTAAYLPMMNTFITKTGSIYKVSKEVNFVHNCCLPGVASTEMKTKLQWNSFTATAAELLKCRYQLQSKFNMLHMKILIYHISNSIHL